jgi:ABC-type branched-subunit amino acid transport system ATPase component
MGALQKRQLVNAQASLPFCCHCVNIYNALPTNCFAGKSTLLRAVSGRLHARSDRQVFINGASISDLTGQGVSIKRLIAYAPQTDEHEPLLTVRETLQFAFTIFNAVLPNEGSDESRAELAGRVDHIIDILHLRHCQNTLIGTAEIRGISGGEKRRVTIGEALLSGARGLALDEITNGSVPPHVCMINNRFPYYNTSLQVWTPLLQQR